MNGLKDSITFYCLQMVCSIHKSLSEELRQSNEKKSVDRDGLDVYIRLKTNEKKRVD